MNAGDGQSETDELHMSDLLLDKTAVDRAVDGSVVTYTIAVRNIGVRDAASALLTDTLPTQATYVAGSSKRDGIAVADDSTGTPFPLDGVGLALGARPGLSLTTVSFDARLSGRNVTATNTASTSTPTPEHTLSNNADAAATALVPPPQADLNLGMTDSPDPVVGGGSTLNYALALRNDGDLPADGVTLTDTLPAGVTFLSATPPPASVSGRTLQFTLGSLAASNGVAGGADEAAVTINVRVDALSGSLTNQASASTTTLEEDTLDNSAQAVTTVQEPPSADLALGMQAPASVIASQRFTYTLSLSNTGSLAASSTTLVDTLPANASYVAGSTRRDGTIVVPDDLAGTPFPLDGTGLNLGSLGIGASTQVSFDVTAPASAATLSNSATVSTTALELDLSDNQSSATTQVQAQADVSIVKSGPATSGRNTTFTYTLTVSNAGPSTATSVVVIDTLPSSGVTYVAGSTRLNGAVVPDNTSGTVFPVDSPGLNIGNLNAGATATITFQARTNNTTGARVTFAL